MKPFTPNHKNNHNEESHSSPPLLVIRPSAGWRALDLHELWQYRDLLWFFAVRDFKIRYKQTVFGGAWAIIQPLFTMVIFTIFFGHLAKIPSDGFPYAVFSYCALVPWQLFSSTLGAASTSMVANRVLVTKIYFPRLIIPLSPLLCALADFGFAFLVLVLLCTYFGIYPQIRIFAVPLLALMSVFSALAVGIGLSALNAIYRDIQYTTNFLLQIWMYASPIVYPISLVPEQYRTIYALNPMVTVIEGFRWALLGKDLSLSMNEILASFLFIGVTLVFGILYFRRVENTLADVV